MRRTAEVAIVGGGVVGCAVAYYLGRKGVTDVVVLEKEHLTSGATGKCGGGLRAQFAEEVSCRIAWESIKLFKDLAEELDGDLEFQQNGYLFLARSQAGLAELGENVAVQHTCGIPSEMVGPAEIAELAAPLDLSGIAGGSYCPADGSANPFLVTYAFARAAARLGAEIVEGCQAEGILTASGNVSGVMTQRGKVAARTVVLAAGAYSRHLAQTADADLPIEPFCHEIMVTERLAHCLDPMIIDLHLNVYCRQERSGGFLAGHSPPRGTQPTYQERSTLDSLQEISAKLIRLIPSLASANVIRQWPGLYDVTPDNQPLLGPVEGIQGLTVAAGFSGHGFMLAPVVGKLMAEVIVEGRASTLPLQPFAPDRFKRAVQRPERAVI